MKPAETYLATFLEQLDAQLGDLPPMRRTEILKETRAHLEAMIAARRADGHSETDAWQLARAAFGEAESIGGELSREWQRAPRVETVGEPLSKREKLKLFARPIGAAVVFSLLAHDNFFAGHAGNVLLVIFAFSSMALGYSRERRNKIQRMSTTSLNWALCVFQLSLATFYLLAGSNLHGTFWRATTADWFFVMMVLSAVASLFVKRKKKIVLPWRYTTRYAENPIAAEETYRLAAKVGLAMGITLSCMSELLWSAKMFGYEVAALNCILFTALGLLYSRWMDGRIS